MSTDEARSSSTSRRLCRTLSESVWIFMPASTLREQAGTSTREPSSSTTQTRQTLTGVSVSSWHNVGVSTPTCRHASRMVEPSSTSVSWPSTLTFTRRRGSPTKTASAIDHLELSEPRGDRVGAGLARSADRRVAHRLRDVAEQRDVRILAIRRQQPVQDLLLPHRADPARHALAAGLVAEEPCDAKQDLLHVGRVVEHDDRTRAKRGSDRTRSFEAQLDVKLLLGHERTGRSSEEHRLQASAFAQAAGKVDQCTQGGAHRDLV